MTSIGLSSIVMIGIIACVGGACSSGICGIWLLEPAPILSNGIMGVTHAELVGFCFEAKRSYQKKVVKQLKAGQVAGKPAKSR